MYMFHRQIKIENILIIILSIVRVILMVIYSVYYGALDSTL